MSNETLSREAVALIKLGEAAGQLVKFEELLREARDQCHRLRRDRLAITRAYDDVCQQLDEARNIARWLYQHGIATLNEGAHRVEWIKEEIK